MNYLPFHHPLVSKKNQISLLSYNILLPNNKEGWWIPKCYSQETPNQFREWPARKKKIESILLSSKADIICIQEAAEVTFHEDFEALFEDGYRGILHKKNNLFRCATFYKHPQLTLLDTRHRFRSLVHLFQWEKTYLGVINVHLSGGPHPKIRCVQIHEALDHLKKMCVQHRIDTTALAVVIMGDFNCNPESNPLGSFLSSGELKPTDRDPNFRDTELTKKGKKHSFPDLFNVYQKCFHHPPSTLYGAPLIDHFCIPHTTKEMMKARKSGTLFSLLKPETIDKILVLYSCYSKNNAMNREEVENWIVHINGGLRGEEWKAVQKQTQPISKSQFINIYVQNLEKGLWWTLASDLHQNAISLPTTSAPMHQDILDHIYIRGLKVISIRTIDVDVGMGLPNQHHPSDHLPIACVVKKANKSMI